MKLNITDNFIISKKDLKIKNPKMDVTIRLKYPRIESIIKYQPKKRKQKIELELKKQYDFLKAKLPKGKTKRLGAKNKPSGIKLSLKYKDLVKLKKLNCISFVSVSNIDGFQKKEATLVKPFFSVKVRIIIQIENQKKGWQEYEDRIVIIQAKSLKKAEKKVLKKLKKEEITYLNPFGYLVKWKVEKVLDCYHSFIEDKSEFDFKGGTEVFSRIKRRKFKKSKGWKKQWEKEENL